MAGPSNSELSLMESLLSYEGRPVRVSLFDAEYKDCFGRYRGILVEVLPDLLSVDCLDIPPAVPAGTSATVELARDGKLQWCHTVTRPHLLQPPHVLHLAWPNAIQTEQQRRSVRADANLMVHYLADGSSVPMTGLILNLSVGGAALQGLNPFKLGQILCLIFSLGSGLFFQDVRAEVVRVSSTRAGSWVAGLRFLDLRPDMAEALGRWVSKHAQEVTSQA